MYLLDSDILVDHLRGRRSLEALARELSCALNHFQTSLISVVELYTGKYDTTNVERLLSYLPHILISLETAKMAGELRRKYGLGVGDAIIAATALKERLVLVTRNLRHFSQIEGLDLRSPKEM